MSHHAATVERGSGSIFLKLFARVEPLRETVMLLSVPLLQLPFHISFLQSFQFYCDVLLVVG